ncbi:urease accessory protein UreD [Kineococcus sp. LSe6-4]|uniref:Urease accessory protein UreD n=1 Tax=Kineococcus halophytocola TaxID=3234027 RepID=A0ABV4GV56_9ACTN
MSTRVVVRVDGALELGVGALAPKVLQRSRSHARVALVGTRALLLAGDRVDVHVEVAAGCSLELVEVAATVAHDGRGGPPARWRTTVDAGPGARVVWDAQPLVVATGADVDRSVRIDLAAGAVVALREDVVLGRTGEAGGRLRARTHARLDGEDLLVEDLDLRDDVLRRSPAVLGASRRLRTVTVLGRRTGEESAAALQLDGPGTLLRDVLTLDATPDGTPTDVDRCWEVVRADLARESSWG